MAYIKLLFLNGLLNPNILIQKIVKLLIFSLTSQKLHQNKIQI